MIQKKSFFSGKLKLGNPLAGVFGGSKAKKAPASPGASPTPMVAAAGGGGSPEPS